MGRTRRDGPWTHTGYTVQWRSGGPGYTTGDRQATVTPGSTTRHTIDSLTNGTTYTVRVIATRSGAIDGQPSAERTGPPREPEPVPAWPLAGAIGLGLLLLGTGGRALRGRARDRVRIAGGSPSEQRCGDRARVTG